MSHARTKLLCTTLLVTGLVAGFAPFAPTLVAAPAHAQQRVEVREEFRVALEPHGRFERHPRLGEVWRPARVAKDWRPYTVGRWVYTDDLGWYWNSDQTEADWGWVAFHYGRWVDDRQMGWIWIPGNEWGPAWVNWRRGEGPAVVARGAKPNNADARYIGWAPLAPDDYEVDYVDNPDVWIFVRARDLVAPRVNTVIIRERRPEFLQRTVIVNRTVVVRDRGVNVNPGISPSYVAAFAGRPIVSYEVRPRVIAGTSRVSNAIEFRTEDLRDSRRMQRDRPVVRETSVRIEAARDVPAPRALETNERGRLGERPPRAAQAPGEQRPGVDPRQGDQRQGDQRQDRTTGERTLDQRGPDQRGADQQRSPTAPGQRPVTGAQEPRGAVGERNNATPGQTGTAPGRAGDTPGQAGTAPGRTGDTPGQARTAPGRAGETPGQAGTAPGRSTEKPTRPDSSAAGQSGQKPAGQSGSAPGQRGATPGQSGSTPGQAGSAPGRTADGPARQQERGAQQREERTQPQQRPERAQGAPERAPAARAQEPAAAARGGREGATGATPNRGGEAERGAQQRPTQKPDAPQRPGQPQ
ncbi:MAG: hypothetical protein Q8M31_14575 [Beijerinckiaceae bacterium]|nr:hypothetical protein [Beijerinckiaceae bacterium]